MKTTSVTNVGCISEASCTFWNLVDDGAKRRALSTLRGNAIKLRIRRRVYVVFGGNAISDEQF